VKVCFAGKPAILSLRACCSKAVSIAVPQTNPGDDDVDDEVETLSPGQAEASSRSRFSTSKNVRC